MNEMSEMSVFLNFHSFYSIIFLSTFRTVSSHPGLSGLPDQLSSVDFVFPPLSRMATSCSSSPLWGGEAVQGIGGLDGGKQ
jgi:hypothetical protein